MDAQLKAHLSAKDDLHPRNQHRERYDFPLLLARNPALQAFVKLNKHEQLTIDFANPEAVKEFNRSLLMQYYGITYWDIPADYLCPSVPSRADYIHYLADLLATDHEGEIPRGKSVIVMDIGMGANCIYPIVGTHEYGWKFIGTDIDPLALRVAKQLVANNKRIANSVECRLQPQKANIFEGVLLRKDTITCTMCNPPFHGSADDVEARARRKWKNLEKDTEQQPLLNFGGQANELWCEGGEPAFVGKMIEESVAHGHQCRWFTCLISKKTTLPGVYAALKRVGATAVRTIGMEQGQKVSRIVAWSFSATNGD